jgi:hypothetical protein
MFWKKNLRQGLPARAPKDIVRGSARNRGINKSIYLNTARGITNILQNIAVIYVQ